MLTEAKELQNEAVDKLVRIISEKKEVCFKAPTGSGKTHMMADFMNRILSENDHIVFLVSSLSKGSLAEQNYDSFEKYSCYEFPKLKACLISSESTTESRVCIESGYNVYVLPRDLYKDKSKLKDDGAFIVFLSEQIKNGKEIYLIKDECHIATGNLDAISDYFSRTINFSATPDPDKGQIPDVEIKEVDAVLTRLIKSVDYMEYEDENDNEKSLDVALDIFEKTKKEYMSKVGISPCMIIQISNKEKSVEEWNLIRRVLDNKHSKLKWMLIVNNKNDVEDPIHCDTNDEIKGKVPVSNWKNFAKGNNSTIDIIIFKMVISEGWDIPRACMLYQIRETNSEQLTAQVIGRVRRNPLLLKYDKEHEEQWGFIMKALVWGVRENYTNEKVFVVPKETSPAVLSEVKVKPVFLREIEKEVNDVNRIIGDALEDMSSTEEIASASIFDVYKKYSKCDIEVKNGCSSYILEKHKGFDSDEDEIQCWISVMKKSDVIEKLFNSSYCDYSKNMYVGTEVCVQSRTYYYENESYSVYIDDWMWIKQYDPDNASFTFDSIAEKKWAEKLSSLSKKKNTKKERVTKIVENMEYDEVYLWGKNFPEFSDIKFQYYLHGVHSSFPDFILKDSDNIIHLFEVKSVNESSSVNVDSEKYKEKVLALMKCYKYASEITGHEFWIPVMRGGDWVIHHYSGGSEELISYVQFEEYMKKKI